MIFFKGRDCLKILTLNTHSLADGNTLENCHILCGVIEKERPDIIALQEVNQFMDKERVSHIKGHIPVGEIPLKESNFALFMHEILAAMKVKYEFSWLGIKKGYDKFDEGLAVFSKYAIKEAKSILLSDTSDYNNFKKRMALFTETEKGVFINCHLGWEDDAEEPFSNQVKRLNTCFNSEKKMYLMGDFNVPPGSDGYKMLTKSGWRDTFFMAEKRTGEATIKGKIDGWENNGERLRIDYIFANRDIKAEKTEVLFDGKKTPQISDHFGVMISF